MGNKNSTGHKLLGSPPKPSRRSVIDAAAHAESTEPAYQTAPAARPLYKPTTIGSAYSRLSPPPNHNWDNLDGSHGLPPGLPAAMVSVVERRVQVPPLGLPDMQVAKSATATEKASGSVTDNISSFSHLFPPYTDKTQVLNRIRSL